MTMNKKKKIIIIDLLYLGDLLFAHPLLKKLRLNFPDAEIDLVANSNFAEIMRINDNLDNVYSYSKNYSVLESYKFAKKIKKKNYDLGINIHGNWRTALLLKIISPEISIGYGSKGRGIFLDEIIEKKEGHMIDIYLDFFEQLKNSQLIKSELKTISSTADSKLDFADNEKLDKKAEINNSKSDSQVGLNIEDGIPLLNFDDNYLKSAENIILNSGLNPDKDFIVLNTGGSWQTKRWPQEYFAELADKLIKKGNRVLFVGGPSDCNRVDKIINMVDNSIDVYNICGQTSLVELAAVLRFADLMISGDTGPVHVAAAVGTNTLTIFGPSDENKYAPRGKFKNIIIKNEGLECRPCGEHRCPLDHHKCMKDIKAEDLIEKITKEEMI